MHGGFWLGLLDSDARDQATSAFYETWDATPGDVTPDGLAGWEAAAVGRWFPDRGRILVPAAGAGREVLPLVTMGYEVVGFDPSERLVDLGNQLLTATWCPGALVHAPPDTVPDGISGPFDAVLFGWGGISHVQGRNRRVGFLTAVREVTAEGAPMLISFLARSDASRTFGLVRTVATGIATLRRSDAPVELGDVVSGSFDHHFTFDEMTDELAAAGFTVAERVGSPCPHILATASTLEPPDGRVRRRHRLGTPRRRGCGPPDDGARPASCHGWGTDPHHSECRSRRRPHVHTGRRRTEITSLGPLSIVGDIRLHDHGRSSVPSPAGMQRLPDSTTGTLILTAFRRRGMAFLDAIDGDYAFVVWDDERRRVLAVRDRFAVKPIFFEETQTGFRFASEVKQLAATSSRPISPETSSSRSSSTAASRLPRTPSSPASIASGLRT